MLEHSITDSQRCLFWAIQKTACRLSGCVLLPINFTREACASIASVRIYLTRILANRLTPSSILRSFRLPYPRMNSPG